MTAASGPGVGASSGAKPLPTAGTVGRPSSAATTSDGLTMAGDGETWEDYAHRLEVRIANQREEIDSLQALRGYPASKADRRRIAHLERLLGQKSLALDKQDAGLREMGRKLRELEGRNGTV